MDALHLKHKEISAEIGSAHDLQAKDQAEIKRLAGMCLDLFRSTWVFSLLKYIPGHAVYAMLDGLSSNAMLFDGFSSFLHASVVFVH